MAPPLLRYTPDVRLFSDANRSRQLAARPSDTSRLDAALAAAGLGSLAGGDPSTQAMDAYARSAAADAAQNQKWADWWGAFEGATSERLGRLVGSVSAADAKAEKRQALVDRIRTVAWEKDEAAKREAEAAKAARSSGGGRRGSGSGSGGSAAPYDPYPSTSWAPTPLPSVPRLPTPSAATAGRGNTGNPNASPIVRSPKKPSRSPLFRS